MEEVKKKRFRPTLTAYREQEMQIRSLVEANRELQEKYDNRLKAGNHMAEEIKRLKDQNDRLQHQITDDMVSRSAYEELMRDCDTLKKSNKFMEDGQIALRDELKAANEKKASYYFKLEALKNRGFLARVFNLDIDV